MEILKIKEILEWIYCIVIAVVLALVVRYFIGTPTVVKQSSMYPTLKEGDRLILNRTSRGTMPKRGEIITLEAPSEKQISNQDIDVNNPIAIYNKNYKNIFDKFCYNILEIGKYSYIKRVIGLPGEHIKIENGKVYINEEELEEDYLQEGIITQSKTFQDIIIPDGYVFVMGDNREYSSDSRDFGCIPIEKIEGIAIFRFWPLNKFGKFI